MTERNQARDAERLPETAARRLLERASELEAARGAELSVAELREAAREAGITPGAFEQALPNTVRPLHHRSLWQRRPRAGVWPACGRPRWSSPRCCRSW